MIVQVLWLLFISKRNVRIFSCFFGLVKDCVLTDMCIVIMDNKCRKFEANIFHKAKCQNCFKSKEEHSAEALENSRVCTIVCHLFLDAGKRL